MDIKESAWFLRHRETQTLQHFLLLLITHLECILQPEVKRLGDAGIVGVLTACLADSNERVRRRMMGTLGELLFYIASQAAERGSDCPWRISQSSLAATIALLGPGEDEIAQVCTLSVFVLYARMNLGLHMHVVRFQHTHGRIHGRNVFFSSIGRT